MFKNVIRGILAYPEAVRMLTRQGWWKYALIPGLISLVFFSILLVCAWGLSDNIGRALLLLYPFAEGRAVAATIAMFVGGVLILAFGLLLFKNVVMLLVSPWMNSLSIKIERQLTGRDYVDDRSFAVAFKRTMRLNCFLSCFYCLLRGYPSSILLSR
jgi:CysZ protein